MHSLVLVRRLLVSSVSYRYRCYSVQQLLTTDDGQLAESCTALAKPANPSNLSSPQKASPGGVVAAAVLRQALQYWTKQYEDKSTKHADRNLKILLTTTAEVVSSHVDLIASGLHCDRVTASKIVQRYPRTLKMTNDKLSRVLAAVSAHNVTAQDVAVYPCVLSRSAESLQILRTELDGLNYKFQRLRLPVISASKRMRIVSILKKEKEAIGANAGRIEALSELFQCPDDTTRSLTVKYPFLASSKIFALKEKAQLLLDHVSLPELLQHLNILLIPVGQMKARLEAMTKAGMTSSNSKFFVNMLRCPECSFELGMARWREERQILSELDCTTRQEYLCKRLMCSTDELQSLHNRLLRCNRRILLPPPLDVLRHGDNGVAVESSVENKVNGCEISLIALKRVLDALLDELAFQPADIMEQPRLLLKSRSFLLERKLRLFWCGMSPLPRHINMNRKHFANLVLCASQHRPVQEISQ